MKYNKVQKLVVSFTVIGLINCKSAGAFTAQRAAFTAQRAAFTAQRAASISAESNLQIKYPLVYINIPLVEAKEILESEKGIEELKELKTNSNVDCLYYSWPILDSEGIITDVFLYNLHPNFV